MFDVFFLLNFTDCKNDCNQQHGNHVVKDLGGDANGHKAEQPKPTEKSIFNKVIDKLPKGIKKALKTILSDSFYVELL